MGEVTYLDHVHEVGQLSHIGQDLICLAPIPSTGVPLANFDARAAAMA